MTRLISAPERAPALLTIGVITLAAAWLGPLPEWARHAFTAHMTLHMIVVAVGAPLVAWGVDSRPWDPVARAPGLFAPLPASVVELVVVWGWHAPALHTAAREEAAIFVAEQASFFAAGMYLWLAARGPRQRPCRSRALAGVGALLFTSMHMTLLGALFALGWRPLYAVHEGWVPAVQDQQLGGVIMLLVGGTSYLVGGLALMREILVDMRGAARPA